MISHLSFRTIFVDTKANLVLVFNTSTTARFVVLAKRTLTPTPALYDFRRVVNIDRLHSKGYLHTDMMFEDVMSDGLVRIKKNFFNITTINIFV